MSWIGDTTELVSGGWLASAYAGHGILGSEIPTSGTSGGSPVLNDGVLSGSEYRWELVSGPAAGTLRIFEDLSFLFTGAPDGSYSFVYRLYQDGVNQGTATVTLNVGAVVADLSGTYRILGSVTADLAGTYSILGASSPVTADLTGVYSILGSVVADLDGSYAVMTSVSCDLAGLYRILGSITKDLSGGYAIISDIAGEDMEPVTVAEAKLAARLDPDDTELDLYIAGVITGAREQAEQITSRVYKRRSFLFKLVDWPAAGELQYVHEPTECVISYWGTDSAWHTMDAADYEFAASGPGAEVAPKLDTSWPVLGRKAVGERVRITFTAGPASPANVSEAVKLYIKAQVTGWIRNPSAVAAKDFKASPLLDHLLDSEIVY